MKLELSHQLQFPATFEYQLRVLIFHKENSHDNDHKERKKEPNSDGNTTDIRNHLHRLIIILLDKDVIGEGNRNAFCVFGRIEQQFKIIILDRI